MTVEDIVKVSRNFQVTIPVRIRQRINIKEGDLVRVVYDEKEDVVKIIPISKDELI
ncbi:AbrB family transcriptional regulator [Sulfolobus sp. SCGC AB-777_L09]|jgi:AbrB family looped-hinge helix DNA binding protein|nr:AbrB/MazE/SpoVT family DNA-binding domain-containing protein [Stygiolobus sp.]MDT7875893.1 AbrB/MazE/SpoVT family DNA-binding domain-containing protein [Sulfolobaceae archaeon]PVU70998.1 AbrB family transcriptional regulator [Sulfolobus sp. SCGC AB-777_L09]